MTRLRTSAVAVALLLALTAPGCRLFRRSSKNVPPPPPPPPPVETAQPAPPSQPAANVPPPPQLPPAQPDLTTKPPEAPVVKLPPPPRGRRRNKKEPPPQEAQAPAAQPAAPEAQASAPPPGPPAPQLEQILTPEQRQAYNEAIDTNITRAQRTLELVQGRRLNSDQKLTEDRIRAFLQQAAEARKSDLFRAKNLAERASVLADDLLRSIQ